MAQRRTYQRNNPYMDGTAAPKLQPVPGREPERAPRREPRRQPQRRQQAVSIPVLSGTSFLFLFCVALITVVFCGSYIKTQSELTHLKNQTISLQQEVTQQQEKNAEALQDILDSVDLSEVYKKATKKFGMVQAAGNQIYTYENRKSDMVKQYADIPSAR